MAGGDMLTIPIMPESRLKAVIQTTALIHAIGSAACFIYRSQLDSILGFPSAAYISIAIGFAMAFHATFLFRLSIKPHAAAVAISAYIHLASACVIAFDLALRIFPYKRPAGFIILSVAAAFQTLTALALLYFSHASSVPYTDTEVISL